MPMFYKSPGRALQDFRGINTGHYGKSGPLWKTMAQMGAQGVGMIRVNFGPISETVYIDIILNTIIER